MSLLHNMGRARSLAEKSMTSECIITRSAGGPVYDEDLEDYVTPDPTVVYTGRCRVQLTESLDVRVVEFGGQAVALSRVTVSVPLAETGVRQQDTVTITAADDAQLVGRTYHVNGEAPAKSHATARRLECELATVPPAVPVEES